MELREVPTGLVREIADEAIGLFIECRDERGYPEHLARRAAVAEVVAACGLDAGAARGADAPPGPIGVVTIDERGRRVPLRSDRADAAGSPGPRPDAGDDEAPPH